MLFYLECEPAVRRARSVDKPIPINCKMRSWAPWSPCNSCTDKKFRFRYMEQPSQFGGSECIENLWDTLACPRATTQCVEPDYCGESFTCQTTGRCISQSLRCNGESDCEDDSDEKGCEQVTSREDKCSTLMSIPGAERGVQGYNVLTGEFVDQVVDPKYFGGQCEYVYNGDWRKFIYDSFCENLKYNEDVKNYRKPYNYHTYHFMAQATSEGSDEYYEDMVSVLNARRTKSSSNFGFTVGINTVEVGQSESEESMFLTNITQHNSQELGFIRLWSKVQTAQFKMRSDKLMLHEDMYVSLMELPEQYDFGVYSRFLNNFGTHYVTEGTMGGTLEYIVVVNKTSMAQSTGGSDSSVVEDIIKLVKGGITVSSAGVSVIRDANTYKRWGETLKYSPTLIEYETMPIYELVHLSTAADHVGERLSNLRRAWDEYLLQFNSCRCAPCKHNGIPALIGTSCRCLCKTGYYGLACEETKRDTKTDGSWSCWGAWSSCQSRRKTRTRVCNNPPPDGGGATCLGSSSQSQQC
ncbi:complement component C8 alpha chain [Diretmus argenteus]